MDNFGGIMTQRQQATVHKWSMRQLMRCEIVVYLNSLCCSFFWFCKPNWSPCPALHGVSTSDRQARNSTLLTSLAAFIVISSSLDSLASSFISAPGFFSLPLYLPESNLLVHLLDNWFQFSFPSSSNAGPQEYHHTSYI